MIWGEVSEFASCGELDGQEGFVMAPFAPKAEQPILVIHPDKVDSCNESDVSFVINTDSLLLSFSGLPILPERPRIDYRQNYHTDFNNFHAHLQNGDFRKLVLSRSVDIVCPAEASPRTPLDLFREACESYPRMMVSLVFTPQSGLWLVATPEVLLSGGVGQWQTMALAGTMAYENNLRWSDKNIQEQRYVATYIVQQLERFTDDFTEEGPYTARAGHLAHLRSDFHFTLFNNTRVGELLKMLHPTPAVCGLPKEQAFQFIQQYEHHHRSYYSGFLGPLAFAEHRSSLQSSHLFVTLRCMQIFRNAYRLHAGGGLLKDSVEEQEWLETETKLDTMRRIISM